MKILFTLIISIAISALPFRIVAQSVTSVYVSPHPDDWQLFMNPDAYHGVKNTNEKVVFIHTTAGDSGNGTGDNNYYLAREEGSLRAIRFMSNTYTSGAGLGVNMNDTMVTINGHNIKKLTYRNVVAYFLRLPDGYLDGSGFSTTNFESLQRLYEGAITGISAIDGSTTYTSLNDLKETLRSILDTELTNEIKFHLLDDDTSINTNSHSDHIYSSRIFREVASTIENTGFSEFLYIDYSTSSMQQNIFGNDYLVCAGTWGATASGLSDNYHSSTWDSQHNAWLGKQYNRILITSSTDTTHTGTNIALNKPTSASGSESGHSSSQAVDGDHTTASYWAANPYTQWWQVDLLNLYDINKIVVTNYYDGTRYYQYDIEASTDGVDWSSIADFNNNTATASNEGNSFNVNTSARYIRVNMNYNSANVGVHIVEFEAYGDLSPSDSTNTVPDTIPDTTPDTIPDITPGTNIALNKPTSASNYQDSHQSSLAVDGNHTLDSWWGAKPYEQWWQVDLLDLYDVSKIIVTNYYDGTRYYQYDIEASADGINWGPLIDFNYNTTPATSEGDTFNIVTTARYIRVNMNYNSANIGVHIVEFEAYGELSTANPSSSTNIALNKPTSAQSYQSGHPTSDVVDGDLTLDSWWGANPYSQWWQVDLLDSFDIDKIVVINYYDGVRYYQYDIEASIDGINWAPIIDFNSNTIPATSQGNTFNITAVARYLRVNMNYNSANVGVHIVEFEAYGVSRSVEKSANLIEGNSEIIMGNSDLLVYPNPVTNREDITLEFNSPDENSATVNVYNIKGEILLKKSVKTIKGSNKIYLNSDTFSKGVNVVSLMIGNETLNRKIYVE